MVGFIGYFLKFIVKILLILLLFILIPLKQVAFGGIAGLFLGCSILSGAEIIYYVTIGYIWHIKRYYHKKRSVAIAEKKLKSVHNMLLSDWRGRLFQTQTLKKQ